MKIHGNYWFKLAKSDPRVIYMKMNLPMHGSKENHMNLMKNMIYYPYTLLNPCERGNLLTDSPKQAKMVEIRIRTASTSHQTP